MSEGASYLEDLTLQDAARWRVRLTELGVESTPEFDLWLLRPENAAAWDEISGPWEFMGEQASAPELAAARQAALEYPKKTASNDGRSRVWRGAAMGIAAVVTLAVVGWGGMWLLDRPDDYSTVRGERSVVTLADGSRVSLDSNSEVTVHYTGSARILQLVRGQARFDVAHDVERPFSVLAGAQKVIATGTAFNIDLNGPKVLVTLIEGHVVVVDVKSTLSAMGASSAEPRHKSVELNAGQQLAALPEALPDIHPANIQRVTAWMNGQLMVDNEPLSEVVAQVNHYTQTQIEIRDPEVAAMRISGVFNTADVSGLVDIVTHYLPVRAVSEADGKVVLVRGGKG
jgi:transmembrane sensor